MKYFDCRLTGPSVAVSLILAFPMTSHAQLAECAKLGGATIDDAAPDGCINSTLSEQIGTGQGDEQTPGSSVYLIKRDPARSIRRGRQLFQRKFSTDEGVGPRVNAASSGSINETRALGAGLADSCAACHGRPRGSAGFGGDVATFPDSRDAPHLFGLGLIEMLADEMSADLRLIRDRAIEDAIAGSGKGSADRQNYQRNYKARRRHDSSYNSGVNGDGSVTRQLISKDIYFGSITANPDGTVDLSNVVGVNADLRVRPFFHHGATVSIREFIVGAFNDEMGLQSWDPILCAVTDPANPQLMISAAGFVFDPETDEFNRPPACDARDDPDSDGVSGEVNPALVDHMEFYLLNYFKPGQYRVGRRAAYGLKLMESIGCMTCHVQNLEVERDRRVADVETNYDPERGIFNSLFAEAATQIQTVDDGDTYPLLLPMDEPFVVENVFTDLKRHNLGSEFHERDFDGTRITEHVTEPLWGVGSTAPYGHDGRSINLDSVIRRHGGEASESTELYERLGEDGREMIQDFLQTLILFPPDDTASNLKPGDPNSVDPQDPDNHGSINLGALFKISDEGEE